LDLYRGSIENILRSLYPERIWNAWSFDESNSGYWESKENRRKFLDWFAKEFKVETPEDWYRVRKADIFKRGGGKMLYLFNGSLCKALNSTLDDFKWLPWLFDQPGITFLDDFSTRRSYADWIASR
jgi:hypothetical protein